MYDLINSKGNVEWKDKLKNVYKNGNLVCFKMIVKIGNNNFKNINLLFNLQYINAKTLDVHSIVGKEDRHDYYNKIFFEE